MAGKYFAIDEEAEGHRSRHVIGKYRLLKTALSLFFLTVFATVVILPFIYMLSISIKTSGEVGNGHFIPNSARDLFGISKKNLSWVRVELTDEEAASFNRIEQVPVGPASTVMFQNTIAALPGKTYYARKLSLEKPSIESVNVIALLEVPDPGGVLARSVSVAVYFPGTKVGTWQAKVGVPIERNLSSALSRMLVNYRILLNWDTLMQGHILAWISSSYPRWYINSLFVAFATVIIGLFFDSLAAFAFAKFTFPFRKPLFAILLATIMIPYPVTLVPTFFIFAKLGFYNTYAALIVPGMVSAFGIFLVRQYLQTIPDDMLDAGRVDGASDFSLYRHVILPTARPVLAALAVFRFIYQWNTYLFPLVLTNRDSMKTVQLGLATMQDQHGMVDYGMQMAGAALAIIPILIVYAFMQKHFISGITLGSVKD
jgi:multiple sugar transport system permease protein